LKVLHVIPAVAPRYGGPSQAIFEMCRALADRGLDVALATTDADGPSRLPVRIGTFVTYQGVPTRFFSATWGERFNYSSAMSRWLRRNVKKFEVVHLHAVFSHPCLAAARACRRRGVPYIVRPLGSLDPWSMRQKAFIKKIVWQLTARQMLEGAAAIHYTTHAERELSEGSLSLERGVVIPLGIGSEDRTSPRGGEVFRDKHPELGRAPYVLAMSRIHPKKNYELLIEAFLSLTARAELAHWRLVIAGDGPDDYITTLNQLAGRRGGSGKVFFVGWLEGAEKASVLRGASLFALPSQQENFGIAVAEALAAGIPALVSEQVNLAADIEEWSAGWVAPLDLPGFSRSLAEALDDCEERRRRGDAGKHLTAERFSWPAISAQMLKLYRAVNTNKANVGEK
jgi:glycosyltransferase involved in cell wall biosynthesis